MDDPVIIVGTHDKESCKGPVILIPWQPHSTVYVCECVLCGLRTDSGNGEPLRFALGPELQGKLDRRRQGRER